MTKKIDNTNVSKHLGQTSEYKSQYDASLLVREPRSSNRKHLDISDDILPFVGNDTWNAYEISALQNNGLPVTGVAKIVYPCNSKYIVESKSIKLYFNSFNMTKLGNGSMEVLESIEQMASADLSKLLETDVQVKLYHTQEIISAPSQDINNEYFDKFVTLENSCLIDSIAKYQESPELLSKIPIGESITRHYHSSLLKSNCRVTSQPDFGDVFISFKSKSSDLPFAYEVSRESLLKYIISFRDECHFHEEICETIYTRLWNMNIFEDLSVMCLYTRRGGIDICPERASDTTLLHSTLSNPDFFHIKTPRQ